MTDSPRGWAIGPLSDFITPRGEKVSPSAFPELPFIGMDHVEAQTTRILGSVPASELKSNAARFFENDVLYGRLRPYLNKVAQPKFDGLASAEFIIFEGNALICPAFLRHRLNARDFVTFATSLNAGDRPRVNFEQIGDFEILVPPINEQRRIVEKIEALFDEIDKGVESLQTARTTLGLYRQSLLKSAFEGRLTADWRAQNADKLEPPETLLARIQTERETRYKAALDDWQEALAQWRADGEKGKKPAKPKRLSMLVVAAAPFPIPENWLALSMGSLGRVETGATPPTKSKENFGGDIPFFKPTDLEAGADVREAREFLSEIGAEKSRPFSAGTILVTCIGATIGKTGLAGVDAACNQQINYIEPDPNFEPRFIYYQITSPFFQDQIKDNASSTTLPILNKGKFTQLPTIICSPAEQAEIARLLDARLEAAARLEAEIDAALTRADALRQSILKQAFSGQLIPQDPSDEPAAALLERIKTERAASPKAKKKRKASA